MLASVVMRSPLREIRARFGDDFAEDLTGIKPEQWAGPIHFGYCLHLMYFRERIDAHLPELDEIRNRVKQDWMTAQQAQMKDSAYARLRKRYVVTVEPNRAVAPAEDHQDGQVGPMEKGR